MIFKYLAVVLFFAITSAQAKKPLILTGIAKPQGLIALQNSMENNSEEEAPALVASPHSPPVMPNPEEQ